MSCARNAPPPSAMSTRRSEVDARMGTTGIGKAFSCTGMIAGAIGTSLSMARDLSRAGSRESGWVARNAGCGRLSRLHGNDGERVGLAGVAEHPTVHRFPPLSILQ